MDCIHRRPVHSISPRRVATICPVHHSIGEIEVQIDRFGQTIVDEFDVHAIRRRLALRNFQVRAKDAPQAGVIWAFLGPVDLAAM